MPRVSRREVRCEKSRREAACANRISTRPTVRTAAAACSENARNHICEASAPAAPAARDGRQARRISRSTRRSRASSQPVSSAVWIASDAASVNVERV